MSTAPNALIDEIITRMITEAKIPYARDVTTEVTTAEGPVVLHGLVFSESAQAVSNAALLVGPITSDSSQGDSTLHGEALPPADDLFRFWRAAEAWRRVPSEENALALAQAVRSYGAALIKLGDAQTEVGS